MLNLPATARNCFNCIATADRIETSRANDSKSIVFRKYQYIIFETG